MLYHISRQISDGNVDALSTLETVMPDILKHEDSRSHFFDFEVPWMCPRYRYIHAMDIQSLAASLNTFCLHAIARGDYGYAWRCLDVLADIGGAPLNLTPPAQFRAPGQVAADRGTALGSIWLVATFANTCIGDDLVLLSAKSPGLAALLKPSVSIIRGVSKKRQELRAPLQPHLDKGETTGPEFEKYESGMIAVYQASFPQVRAAIDASLGKLVGSDDSTGGGAVQR